MGRKIVCVINQIGTCTCKQLRLPQFLSSLPSEHVLVPVHRAVEEMHWPLVHRNWVNVQPKCLCAKREYIIQLYMQVQVLKNNIYGHQWE